MSNPMEGLCSKLYTQNRFLHGNFKRDFYFRSPTVRATFPKIKMGSTTSKRPCSSSLMRVSNPHSKNYGLNLTPDT